MEMNRRRFLQSTAYAGVGFWLARRPALAGVKSPNEKVNIACVGVGGKGSSDTDQAGNYGNIVAICDVDDQRLEAKARRFPDAKKYCDFRKMLEEMDKQIDAVVVSTPDHTHAPASLMAMKMGKHVYCQKPLTHTVHEARQMRETARRHRVATQMGNQGTASNGIRQAVEIIRSGAIGNVREVHVWTNRPFGFWRQAPEVVARPSDTPPIPPHVHWDEFLGPAPYRPYHSAYHPFAWRGWRDFGTGALGDMACHTANLPFMALKLGLPKSVWAENGEVNPETYQGWANITYEFPEREGMPSVKLIWHEGARSGVRNLPHPDLLFGERPSDSGSLLIGDKGTMYSPSDYGANYRLLPAKNFEGYTPPAPTLPRLEGGNIDANMKMEWVRAIQGGPPPTSNFDYAGTLTEAILLGNVAVQTGHKIEYNARRGHITNCREAVDFLKTEYRVGWRV
jgi:predicted dehydrogenase